LGTLTLPANGPVYVDANVIIYRVEAVQPYLAVARPLWDMLDLGAIEVITSELSMLEVLVKPIQLQNVALQTLFLGTLYGTPGLSCIPITRETLQAAAELRATIGLKTPDAIHAAAAVVEGCTLFVTNDAAFRRISGLNVAILSEIAAAP
jgi:predicted nucleic acid-binding protein